MEERIKGKTEYLRRLRERDILTDTIKEALRRTPKEIAELERVGLIKEKEEAQVKTLDKDEKVNEIIGELNSDVQKNQVKK